MGLEFGVVAHAGALPEPDWRGEERVLITQVGPLVAVGRTLGGDRQAYYRCGGGYVFTARCTPCLAELTLATAPEHKDGSS
jgi:hypothetical protein